MPSAWRHFSWPCSCRSRAAPASQLRPTHHHRVLLIALGAPPSRRRGMRVCRFFPKTPRTESSSATEASRRSRSTSAIRRTAVCAWNLAREVQRARTPAWPAESHEPMTGEWGGRGRVGCRTNTQRADWREPVAVALIGTRRTRERVLDQSSIVATVRVC